MFEALYEKACLLLVHDARWSNSLDICTESFQCLHLFKGDVVGHDYGFKRHKVVKRGKVGS